MDMQQIGCWIAFFDAGCTKNRGERGANFPKKTLQEGDTDMEFGKKCDSHHCVFFTYTL